MKKDICEKVKSYMLKHAMILSGERVTVALSGGADSVALLLLLCEISEDPGFSVRYEIDAIHINHGLRGADADADETFVKELCEKCSVPLTVRREDVGAYAKARALGIEEAGREVRRASFAERKVVALAHHENDQAETFLFRAARGTSISGLACMRPTEMLKARAEVPGALRRIRSHGEMSGEGTRLIRPLLAVSRGEIEDWLRACGQAWREDTSNQDEKYTRNAIRHSVLPALSEKVNTEAVRHIAAAAESVAAAETFLHAEAMRRADGLVRTVPSLDGDDPKNEILLFEEIRDLPEILQGYIILEAVQRVADTRRDIGRLHVEQVRDLFGSDAGKRAELPHGITAARERDAVRLKQASPFSML